MAEEQKNPRKPYKRKNQPSTKEKPEQVDESQNIGMNLEENKIEEVEPVVKVKKERKQISVCSKRVQFYRAGMRFSKTPTILFVDSLKSGVLERLKNESWLVVTEL